MNHPIVSILIPAYNVEKYIDVCVESVISQSYKNIEIIVINDCSQDRTFKILSEYRCKSLNGKILRIINLTENKGLANARNVGIGNASGKYIFHLDGDDWLSDTKAIEEMVALGEDEVADIVEADYYIVTGKGKEKRNVHRNYSTKDRIITDIILKKTPITIWNKLIKLDLYKDNNIRVPIDISNGEDYITLPRLIYYCNKIVHLNRPTYCYNQLNVNSFSNNRKKTENLLMLMRTNHFIEVFFEDKGINNNIFSRMYFESRCYGLLYSENPSTFDILLKTSENRKCSLKTYLSMRIMYKIVYIFCKIKFYWMITLFNRLITMAK